MNNRHPLLNKQIVNTICIEYYAHYDATYRSLGNKYHMSAQMIMRAIRQGIEYMKIYLSYSYDELDKLYPYSEYPISYREIGIDNWKKASIIFANQGILPSHKSLWPKKYWLNDPRMKNKEVNKPNACKKV